MSSLTSNGPSSSLWTLSSLPQTIRRLVRTLFERINESLHASGMGNRSALSMPITTSMGRPFPEAHSLLSQPGKKTFLRLAGRSSIGPPVPITGISKKLRKTTPLRDWTGSSWTSVTRVPDRDKPSSMMTSHICPQIPCCFANLEETEEVKDPESYCTTAVSPPMVTTST